METAMMRTQAMAGKLPTNRYLMLRGKHLFCCPDYCRAGVIVKNITDHIIKGLAQPYY